jgi:hypothetical protein
LVSMILAQASAAGVWSGPKCGFAAALLTKMSSLRAEVGQKALQKGHIARLTRHLPNLERVKSRSFCLSAALPT